MISAMSSIVKALKCLMAISIVAFATILIVHTRVQKDIPVDLDREYVSKGFRIDAFLNSTDKEMELRFGEHFAEELQDEDKWRGAAWWPSWSPQSSKVFALNKDQIALLRLYGDGDRTVYIWYVRYFNNVWKVVKDITPPSGWIE